MKLWLTIKRHSFHTICDICLLGPVFQQQASDWTLNPNLELLVLKETPRKDLGALLSPFWLGQFRLQRSSLWICIKKALKHNSWVLCCLDFRSLNVLTRAHYCCNYRWQKISCDKSSKKKQKIWLESCAFFFFDMFQQWRTLIISLIVLKAF